MAYKQSSIQLSAVLKHDMSSPYYAPTADSETNNAEAAVLSLRATNIAIYRRFTVRAEPAPHQLGIGVLLSVSSWSKIF